MDTVTTSVSAMYNSTTPTLSNGTGPGLVTFDDEWQRILVALILVIASVTGTFGNFLILLSVLLSRKLRSPTNVFVVNLSVADLLTGIALPWNVVALLSFDHGWPLPDWICSVAAVVLYIPIYCSVLTLASIGINRLIIITRPVHVYRKIFCTKVLCVWLALLWMWPFVVVVIPPLAANFGLLGYNEKFHTCSSVTSNNNSDNYDILTSMFIYPVPLAIIVVSYVKIFVHVRHKAIKLNVPSSSSITEDGDHPLSSPTSPQHVQVPSLTIQASINKGNDPLFSDLPISRTAARAIDEAGKFNSLPSQKTCKSPHGINRNTNSSCPPKKAANNNRYNVSKKRNGLSLSKRIRSTIKEATNLNRTSRRQMAITKNMFYVVIAYLICLTPFVFCLLIDTTASTHIIPYAAALVFFNSCVNPAIYAIKHPNFKKIFSLILRCRWHQIQEPSDTLRALMRRGLCTPK